MPRGGFFLLLLGRVPTQIRVFVCAPFRSPASHTQFVNAGLQGTAEFLDGLTGIGLQCACRHSMVAVVPAHCQAW